jgi:nitrite reductase/ring-hydroxylating ferredoxin subunit
MSVAGVTPVHAASDATTTTTRPHTERGTRRQYACPLGTRRPRLPYRARVDGDAADDGWMPVTSLDDLPVGRATRVDLDGTQILLYRSDVRIYAIGNRCTHQGAPLDRGRVHVGPSEATVTCPVHGSVFRLTDGAVIRSPATSPVASFEVRVDDGSIALRPSAR